MEASKKQDFYQFPDNLAAPEEKATADYGIRYARAIWSRHQVYLSNYSEQKNRWILNRKYSAGMQSVQKYKDLIDDGDTSWMNLDFTPIAIIPKFVNNICGLLTNNRYKIDCEVLNSVNKVTQDDVRNKLYANKLLKPVHDAIAPVTGMSMLPEGSVVPQDEEEMDIYMAQNYKPAEAMAMQLALKYVFEYNNFQDIEKQVIRDLVDLKWAAIKRYYDKQMNICLEWTDPVDLVFPYSKYDDFKNIPWIAVNKKYTIQEIAQMNQEFTEEDLYEIAKQYQGNQYGNRPWGYGISYAGYYQSTGVMSGRAYDDFNISVLEFEFLGIDSLTYEKKTSKQFGNSYFNKKSSDYAVQATDKKYTKEVVKKHIKNRYEGKWIIGSNYMFDYKKANNIPREKVNGVYSTEATLSIKVIAPQIWDMQNKSITESIIPFADQLNLIHLKIQQILMKMAPAGYFVDLDAIENVMVGAGGKTMTPLEVIKMMTQTGSGVFRRTKPSGAEMNGDPIKFNQGGVPAGFELLLQQWNLCIQNMYAVTGYNPAAAGDANNEALVGVQQQQLAATNNTLKPLTDSYIQLVTKVAKETGLMIQDKIEYGDGLDGFERAIGKESIEVIKAAEGLPMCEFGIKANYMPNDADLAKLDQKIQIALQEQIIDLADAVQVEQQAKTDVKLAIQLLLYLKKQRAKAKQQEAQQNSQMNTQTQVQSAQAAEQAKQSTLQMEIQGKMQLMQQEYALKAKNFDQEHAHKMEELMVTADHNTDAAKLSHDLELLKTAFENSIAPKTPAATQ